MLSRPGPELPFLPGQAGQPACSSKHTGGSLSISQTVFAPLFFRRMTGQQTRSDVLLELCGPSTGHPTRPGTAGLRPRVDTGRGGWGVEQGESQAWGPAGSGASGTGVIAASRGGEVCRSQQGGWCAGCGAPGASRCLGPSLQLPFRLGKWAWYLPTGPRQRTKPPPWIHTER